jgi:hypothetical protein
MVLLLAFGGLALLLVSLGAGVRPRGRRREQVGCDGAAARRSSGDDGDGARGP